MELHMSGFVPGTTQQQIYDAFREFGRIGAIRLGYRPGYPDEPANWAMVRFTEARDATTARAALDGTEFHGTRLHVSEAHKPQPRRQESPGVFLSGLPFSAKISDVKELFRSIGLSIGEVFISMRENGESKGYGFVDLANDELVQAAISALNGALYGGRTLRCEEKRARQ